MSDTETLVDESIASGGSASGTFAKPKEHSSAILRVVGDSNSTDLDFDVTGVAADFDDSVQPSNHSHTVTGVDASTSDQIVIIHGLDTVGRAEVTVTNNAASASTVTVTQDD